MVEKFVHRFFWEQTKMLNTFYLLYDTKVVVTDFMFVSVSLVTCLVLDYIMIFDVEIKTVIIVASVCVFA